MKKRILSMILSFVMIFTMVPTFVLPASTASVDPFSGYVSDSADDDGVALSKSVTYDPETGKVTTVMEAYTTGTVTPVNVTKPTDIILVLDVSGSMEWAFDGTQNNSDERLNAMKTAVNSFIDQTAKQNELVTAADDMHSIAIVTFASSSSVLANFTTVDATGSSTLKGAVNKLSANGSTAVDYGLTDASELLSARAEQSEGAYAEREKVVIVFTDGDPTHGSTYEDSVAYSAVQTALAIKSSGAKIYTIGIFNGANVSGTDKSNIFMNYVSTNYPKAYGSTETAWLDLGLVSIPYTKYSINPGDAPYYTDYYMTANDASSLNNIFSTISSQIGKPNVELGSAATLIDVVSDYFTIEGLGSTPTITAQTSAYQGGGKWATPVTESGLTPVLTGADTITINGFDFDSNYVSETARDGFYGKKLILTFVTIPNYEKIDEAGAFADALIPTNATTALLDSEGNAVEYISSPTLTANTVTYRVIDSTTRTVDTFYRLPGSTITLKSKPSDTAEYSYGEWTTQDVTLSGTTFTMPETNVVLTSTGTLNSYTVYYTYTGNVPTGTQPATAPQAATYTVGANVTHPTVTAPDGYTFSGWTEDGGDVESGVKSFNMPSEDLHFEGYFVALDSSYTVEHYLMDTEGNYPETADHSNVYENVKTGELVSATTPDHAGFIFDENADNVLSGTVTANGGLVLKVYYARKQHTVTYKYDGTVPGNADPSTTGLDNLKQVNVYYGAEVTIAQAAKAEGYTFSGWRIFTGDTAINNGKMIMPDSDVVLHGSFTASGDTPYTIEHYFENLNDNDYSLDETKTSKKTGMTDTIAYAEPLAGTEITGFTYDAEKTAADGAASGTISGDGKLVLKLYYTRTRHTVMYEYTGTVPAKAEPSAAELTAEPYTVTVKYGTEVKIADAAKADGYTFVGWNITGTDISVNDGTFIMPARDVVLTGHFNPIPAKYTVQHWLENSDGTYTQSSSVEFTADVYVNDQVSGTPYAYNTYTYDPTKTASENKSMTEVGGISVPAGTVTADGSLVLKLYYTRNAYDITYIFENNPGNAEIPADQTDVKHGTDVTLASVTVPVGYNFEGWYYGEQNVGNSLTMPATDVELVGRFVAKTQIPYTVKYFLQNTDGSTYTEDKENSYVEYGYTGQYVAAASKVYTGFSFDTTQGAWNGHIAGDGSLVLELYYNRNSYTVSYYYFGTAPADVAISMGDNSLTLNGANPLIMTGSGLYGATMTVESALTASDENYEFKGWYTFNLPGVNIDSELSAGTTYTMPAHNVEFRGTLHNYTVYYNLDGGTLNGKETVDPKQVNWDDAGLLPEGTPQKANLIFSGWSNDNKTAFVTNSDKYSDLAKTTDVEIIVLTAEYANGYTVSYDWGTENVPASVTLPTDSKLYADGDSYTVDTTYTANYTIEVKDSLNNVIGVYTFSGWTDPSQGTIDGANVVITGKWTYTPKNVNTWTVTYEWTNAPESVTKPETVTGIVNGSLYTVDTTYTSETKVPVKDSFNNVIGYFTFSGWDKSGTLTVTSNITISGTWTYKAVDVPVTPPVIPVGTVELIKVDAEDNSTVLSGVVFELYRANGTYIGTYATDKNGEIKVSDLLVGNYYWVETHPAEGYILDNTKRIFTVSAWKTTYVVVENSKSQVPSVFGDDHYAYIIGYDDGLVHPEANITRAEVATIFFRLLSEETRAKYKTRDNNFSDVNQGNWYNVAVSTMAAMGIVTGRPGGVFDPNANITRAEFAAIAARFDEHGNTTDASFTDIYKHWAKKEINIAANNGWVLGYEDGTFRPDQYITRAEAMTMVNRVLQRIPETDHDLLPNMVIWPDNMNTKKWYYRMVQEATNSHYYARKINGYEYWIALRPVPDWASYEK